MSRRTFDRTGFSLPELLVVVGVIGVILAFLFPALSSVLKGGKMTSSLSNLRQVSQMMELYSRDNRETIVPSQFDYSGAQFTYKGKVRSAATPPAGDAHEGTWTDILWTFGDLGANTVTDSYRFDSPDSAFYDEDPDDATSPFRSTARNTDQVDGGTGPLPFGNGAQEIGQPGYFAANDFFNARPDASGDPSGPGTWYVLGEVRAPSRAMYLIDSFAGEIIEPLDENYDVVGDTTQVDFRYNDLCLMLFLDGHTQQEGFWADLAELEDRQIRVVDPLSP